MPKKAGFQTSSLAIKAEFPNPKNQRMLMPGQFVRVRLVGATYKDAVLIPSSAVLSTPTGDLVYIVQEDGTTKAQPVTVQMQDNMYIVNEGLEGGETVISEGLLKIRPGMKVSPQMKDFGIPSYEEPTAPSSMTAQDIGEFDDVIKEDVKPDTQSVQQPARKNNKVTNALLGRQD